ncbi:MAG: hypothetical protein WC875_02440 [Candidatus Absconditabacterales bacterium]
METLGWIIIVGIIIYLGYKGYNALYPSIEDIEKKVDYAKKNGSFMNNIYGKHVFDTMESNYFRLKERFSDDKKKLREIAKNWHKYVLTLWDISFARVLEDENFTETTKESQIIKDEIEKKFKALLGNEWQDPDLDSKKKKH